MKLLKDQSGFTLIELIIVVAILAIIVAIAIPNIVSSINESRKATDVASGKIIADAAGRVLALEGKYSGFEISALNISDLSETYTEGAPYNDDFQADLFTALSKKVPEPKYVSLPITADNFILSITEGRIIEVFVGSGSDNSTGNALLIYPNPAQEYE